MYEGDFLVDIGLTDEITKMNSQEWLDRYKARMIERGLDEIEAQNCVDAASLDPINFEDEPEDAADDELSYWASDS